MFVYEVKELYNEAGDGPFEGMVVKPGTDFIPAVAGETVLFVKEIGNGEIELVDEFVVGEKPEEQKENYYFYSHLDGEQDFVELETPYTALEEYPIGADGSDWYILVPSAAEIQGLLCVKKDAQVICRTSSGYNLDVRLYDTNVGMLPSEEYKAIEVYYTEQLPEDFYDKKVTVFGKQCSATDIVISTNAATFACTVYIIPMQ